MQKDWFEEIIRTIENNSEDNKATISNVKLWAKSWREEKEIALTLYGVTCSSFKGCKYPNKICRYIEGGIVGEACDYCK